jgi:DNA-binding LacI/PurR family transcriptional regulator
MRITLSDIAKKAGVSVSTVSRTLNKPETVSQSTRLRVLKVINELDYKPSVNINKKILEYKNYMATKPNDTVLRRWGMYTHDSRYKDYTASIVKMIMDDMQINEDQAYYMLYYIVSNDLDDYELAKRDMMVDKNFEIYKTKRR